MESSVAFIAGLGVTALLGIVLAGMAMMADKTAIVVPPEADHPEVTANREEKVVNTIDIGRRRLCDPTGLVYEVFEKDADRAGTRWMLDGEKMFNPGSTGAGSGLEPGQVRRRTVRVGLQGDGFGFYK
ncbi:hypothetical protein PIIN_11086 [Serendipita indica DSM 11827]|uniref:Uncharacterized protein n=1 Tax=Serendipita indica (strain DSM 11827) TaxID=1109443 RepID=G4U0L0_SERID|nr:hypothetical protein PIIN_11086 [Serendipita indica DSM 11827]